MRLRIATARAAVLRWRHARCVLWGLNPAWDRIWPFTLLFRDLRAGVGHQCDHVGWGVPPLLHTSPPPPPPSCLGVAPYDTKAGGRLLRACAHARGRQADGVASHSRSRFLRLHLEEGNAVSRIRRGRGVVMRGREGGARGWWRRRWRCQRRGRVAAVLGGSPGVRAAWLLSGMRRGAAGGVRRRGCGREAWRRRQLLAWRALRGVRLRWRQSRRDRRGGPRSHRAQAESRRQGIV